MSSGNRGPGNRARGNNRAGAGNGAGAGTGLGSSAAVIGNLLSFSNSRPATDPTLPLRLSLLDELASVYPQTISPPTSSSFTSSGFIDWLSSRSNSRPDTSLMPGSATAATLVPSAASAASPASATPSPLLSEAWSVAAVVPTSTEGKISWAEYFAGLSKKSRKNLSPLRAALREIFINELKIEYKPSTTILGILKDQRSPFFQSALRVYNLGKETYAQKFFLLKMYRLYIDTLEKSNPASGGTLLMYTNRLMEDIFIYTYLNTLKEDEKAFFKSLPIILNKFEIIYDSDTVIHQPGFIKNTDIPIELIPKVFAEAVEQFLSANPAKASAFLLAAGATPSDMPIIAGTGTGVNINTRLASLSNADNLYKEILSYRASAFGSNRAASAANSRISSIATAADAAAGTAGTASSMEPSRPNYSGFGPGPGPMPAAYGRVVQKNPSNAFKPLTGINGLNSLARGVTGVGTRAAAGATSALASIGSATGAAAKSGLGVAANYASRGASKFVATAPGAVAAAAAAARSAASGLASGTLRVANKLLPNYRPTGPADLSDESDVEVAVTVPTQVSVQVAAPAQVLAPGEVLNTMITPAAPVAAPQRQGTKRKPNNNGNGNANGYEAENNSGPPPTKKHAPNGSNKTVGGRRTVKRKGRNARKPTRKSRKARKNITRRR